MQVLRDARTISRNGTPADVHWTGVYDRNRMIVPESLIVRGDVTVTGRVKPREVAEVRTRLRGEYTYGGHVESHFGHMLLETFARLAHYDCNLPLLFTSHTEKCRPVFWSLIDLFGLSRERVTVLDAPAIVERLHVAPPGFVVRQSISDAFSRAYETVGACVGPENNDAGPLYLSRSRTSQHWRYFFGERTIESILRRNGVEIAYVEDLTIRDQVALFRSRREIVGFAGSAMHHMLFCTEPKKITYLDTRPLNDNYVLIESRKRNAWRFEKLPEAPCRAPGGKTPYLLSQTAIARVCRLCGVEPDPAEIAEGWRAERCEYDQVTRILSVEPVR